MAVVEGKAKVTLDGADAGATLKRLETSALDLKKALIDLKKSDVLDNKKIKDTEAQLKSVNKEMKLVKDQTVSYQNVLKNLSGASLKDLETASRKLAAEVKTMSRNTDEYKKKAGNLSQIKSEISKVKREMYAAGVQTKTFGDRLRSIGTDLLAAGGLYFGFQALIGVIKGAFTKIKEFASGISELKAITGLAGDDLNYLKQAAKDLGAQYGTSAKDIVEGMKLVGSARPELLGNAEALSAMTEQVLIFSKASGLDMATSTEAIAGALNQFNEPASKAGEYINLMAAAAKEGSAEIPYLSDVILRTGKIAKDSGLSMSELTTYIEELAPSFSSPERAATQLNNVLLNLKTKGLGYQSGEFKLNDALAEAKERLDGTADGAKRAKLEVDLFGKEGLIASKIMIQNNTVLDDNTTAHEKLAAKIKGGTNEALKQASDRMNNLQGDIDKATGTYDKFILSIEDGDGPISKALRSVTQGFTDLLNQLTVLNDTDATFLEKTEAGFRTLGKIIPGAGTAIDNFKKSWKSLFGSDDLEISVKQIEDAKKRGIKAAQDEIAANKAKNEKIKQDEITLTEEQKKQADERVKANKEAYKKMLKDTEDLNDQINEMAISLIEDEQLRSEAEVELWHTKELEKINITTAEKTVKDAAIETLEEVHQQKLAEINDRYLSIELDRIEKTDKEIKASHEKQLKDKKKQEEDYANSVLATREKYGLVPLQEQLDSELAQLKENFDKKLLSEDEYIVAKLKTMSDYRLKDVDGQLTLEEQKAKIIDDFRKQEIEKERQAEEEKLQIISEKLMKTQAVMSSFGNFFSSLKDAELAKAGDNEEKKKQIMKKYADIEMAVKIGQIVASTALAIIQAFAQLGPIAGGIAAIFVGATGAVQVGMAVAERNRIKGLASGGKFGVTRSQDGKKFNAEYGGNGHGYYEKPTVLVAEEGPEFVVSNKALQVPAFKRAIDAIDSYQQGYANKRLNYNGLMSRRSGTPGLADGGFTNQQQTQNNDSAILISIFSELASLRTDINSFEKDKRVIVVLDDIQEAETTINSLRAEVTL